MVELDIDLEDKIMRNLFISLAKTGICLDDLITCFLKEQLVIKEMEKL